MTPEERLRLAIEALNVNVQNLNTSVSRIPNTNPATTPASGAANAAGTNTSGTSFQFDASKIGDDFGKLFNTISNGLKGVLEQAGGAFGSIVGDVTELYKRIDNGRAEFIKQSGDLEKALPLYYKFSSAVRGLGIEYSEAAIKLADLIKEVPGFIDLSEKEQLALAKQSAALSRIGVQSNEIYATLKTTLGLSTKELLSTTQEVMNFSKALGVPANIIMKDFGNAMPKLVLFGEKAVDVFKNSEIISKKFGISLETILGMVDKFDTFESAAEAAGNLNAVFRENLFDTQELLLATDPADKIKLFASNFEKYKNMTGQSFDDFDVFTKKAIAKQSGIDIKTLEQISKMTGDQLSNIQNNIKMNKDGTFEIEKAAEKTVTIDERMSALRDRVLSAFLPLLEKMQPILDKMADFAKMFADGVSSTLKNSPGLTSALGGVASAMGAFSLIDKAGVLKPFTGILDTITAFIPGADKLSGFVMPTLGVGLAGLVATADKTNKSIGDVLKENSIFQKFNLDDKQIKLIQDSLNGVADFAKSTFKNLLSSVGFSDTDIDGIMTQMRDVLSSAYTKIMEWVEDIKKVLGGKKEGGFIGAFFEKMSSSTQQNPFLKIAESVAAGLRAAVVEIKKLIGGGGETASPVMKEFSDAIGEFIDTLKGAIKSSFGSLFGEDGKGGFLFNFLNTISSSDIFKEFGKTILETISGVFTGLGSILTAVSGGVDFPKIGAGIKSFMGDFVGAFSNISYTTFSGTNVTALAAAATGIGKLGETFKNFNADSTKSFNESLGALVPALSSLENAKPVSDNLIQSLNKLAEALVKLNPALVELDKNKQNLGLFTEIPAEKVTRLEGVATAVERYSKAVSDLQKSSDEQDKLQKVLASLAAAVGSMKLEIESEKMGEIIGDKVAIAIHKKF